MKGREGGGEGEIGKMKREPSAKFIHNHLSTKILKKCYNLALLRTNTHTKPGQTGKLSLSLSSLLQMTRVWKEQGKGDSCWAEVHLGDDWLGIDVRESVKFTLVKLADDCLVTWGHLWLLRREVLVKVRNASLWFLLNKNVNKEDQKSDNLSEWNEPR